MYTIRVFVVISLISYATQKSVTKKKHHFVTVDEFDNLYIHCDIKPGCKKNKIADMDFGSIQVELKSKDVGKECNDELIKFLAKVLKVKEDHLSIEKGESSEEKLVLVDEVSKITLEDLEHRVAKAWRPLDVDVPEYRDDWVEPISNNTNYKKFVEKYKFKPRNV